MDVNAMFPSNFLKASDLQGQEVSVTISRINYEKMSDGSDKPVVYFMGKEKGLVLNKTNATTIADMYGNDTDAWTNAQITLGTIWTDFQGKQVQAIRVRPNVPQRAGNGQQQPMQGPSGEGYQGNPSLPPVDDEIPF